MEGQQKLAFLGIGLMGLPMASHLGKGRLGIYLRLIIIK